MLLDFDNPLWTRLYGPYGVENCAPILCRLMDAWDDDLAGDLLWEKLYHQGSLYPVTYAALPYLWAKSCQLNHDNNDLLFFLAEVCFCSDLYSNRVEPTRSPSPHLSGLSLTAEDHQLGHLDKHSWLTVSDLAKLRSFDDWFRKTYDSISEKLVQSTPSDNFLTSHYYGPLALKLGAPLLAIVLRRWADGHEISTLSVELGEPSVQDIRAAKEIVRYTHGTNNDVTEALCEWAEVDLISQS